MPELKRGQVFIDSYGNEYAFVKSSGDRIEFHTTDNNYKVFGADKSYIKKATDKMWPQDYPVKRGPSNGKA